MLHADRVQASAETYVRPVEVGVGLIPAAEARRKCFPIPDASSSIRDHRPSQGLDGAPDARRLRYLRDLDGVTMNRDRLVFTTPSCWRFQARPAKATGRQPARQRFRWVETARFGRR